MDEYTEKVISLFTYLKEFSVANQKLVTNIDKQLWHVAFSDIPTYKDYVSVEYRDETDEEEDTGNADDVIVSVKSPNMDPCPYQPQSSFVNWLNFDWKDYKSRPQIIDKGIPQENGKIITDLEYLEKNQDDVELFRDDPKRVDDYNIWLARREGWVEEQKPIGAVKDFFMDLYMKYKELEADSETKELLCGNLFITVKGDDSVKHPILLKRLKLTYESENNTICIRDTTAKPEIYTLLLSSISTSGNSYNLIDPAGVKAMNSKVDEEEIHPLDRTGAEELIEEYINRLNPDNKIFSEADLRKGGAYFDSQIAVALKPVLFVRKRINGAINALEKITRDIKENEEIPQSILDIVGKYEEYTTYDRAELTPIQRLAEIGGEDPDILLPLPANREQLEIARRINEESAVLVQGPPGTGKTHTIANLLGNFLAQGKSVLVTSDTRKALSVLKDKVPEELQALCVSLLDENNRDMEKSVDGIVSFISKHTQSDARRQMESAVAERNHLIQELSKVRDSIYKIKYRDFQPIVYEGSNYSLIDIAKYVHDNIDRLSQIIPGDVVERDTLPLSYEELSDLYASNVSLTKEEEYEIGSGLPNPESFPSVYDFEDNARQLQNISQRINELSASLGFQIQSDYTLTSSDRSIHLGETNEEHLQLLQEAIKQSDFSEHPWKLKTVIDGKNGGGFSDAWIKLIGLLQDAGTLSDTVYLDRLENRIEVKQDIDMDYALEAIEKLLPILKEKGKISGLQRMSNSKYIKYLNSNISVNGQQISTAVQFEAAEHYIILSNKRNKVKPFWDSLVASNGGVSFDQLQMDFPEQQAMKFIPEISRCLTWYKDVYPSLNTLIRNAGIEPNELFRIDPLKRDEDNLRSVLSSIQGFLPSLIQLQYEILAYEQESSKYTYNRRQIDSNNNGSQLMNDLQQSYESFDFDGYQQSLNYLQSLYYKESLINVRSSLLQKLHTYAPGWAYAIQIRSGIHGKGNVPSDISNAWKWKQFEKQIKFFIEQSYDELQDASSELSRRYRIATEKAAKWSAWYHLLQRIEGNKMLEQSLTGWRLTMKRIGKGTGKRAAKLRKTAREHMKVCQNAVPVWIMTMNQVFDNLTPGDNKYDVVIVDEASQSNITALALAYYGSKIIIVGDDKQVSPLAVGMEEEKINALINTYLSEDIPNRDLYTTRISLYDIALTTFKPLMLHEHFRCVPEIIGYSNMLSYDNKILPLRDTNSTSLKPAIISYNAQGRRSERRNVKTNVIEQNTVIALLKACFEIPEYENKTFGVISMLGDRQAEEIQARLSEDPEVLEKHKVLFGNSAQFQGDERDVIILTLVDSNEGEGPLKILTDGIDEANKKRYNVAVSRARDQLWIIHSFNRALDLKDGDIRKTLLNYAENPMQYEQILNAENHSESPFEKDVALKLTARGYRIVQQWDVGSYRIDMVAMDANGKVAIECDGERWHSGQEVIQRDMERQTILERIGWTFIRIRGCEFYADPEVTINRVVEDLNRYGIKPYSSEESSLHSANLKDKVICKMKEYLDVMTNGLGSRADEGDGNSERPDEADGTEELPDDPSPTDDIKQLYSELLGKGLWCFLKRENQRIYVLYSIEKSALTKSIVSKYSSFKCEYKNPSVSPIINEMAFVIRRIDDHGEIHDRIPKDRLVHFGTDEDTVGGPYPGLPPHIINDNSLIVLYTPKLRYFDKKNEIAMKNQAEFKVAFNGYNLSEKVFRSFYMMINETGEIYKADGVDASISGFALHLKFSGLCPVRIEESEMRRFVDAYHTDTGFGRFCIHKKIRDRKFNNRAAIQIAPKTEEEVHSLSKENREGLLHIPYDDDYDEAVLNSIDVMLVKGVSSFYKCSVETKVNDMGNEYVIGYRIINRSIRQLDDPIRFRYSVVCSFYDTEVGNLSILKQQ